MNMLATEVAALKDELSELKQSLARTTRATGPNSPHLIKAKNSSGSNSELGDVVVTTGFDSDLGMATYGIASEDNGRDVLGVVTHQITSGEVGYVCVTGVCLCKWDIESGTPAAGMPIGTRDGEVVGRVGNFSLGYFQCQVTSDLALISIDRSERLIADHRISNLPSSSGHIESSGIYEPIDLLNQTTWVVGKLSDLMSVVLTKSGTKSSWTTALDFRRVTKHNHGWFKGVVIEEGGTGTDIGWGPIADIIGIRGPDAGQSHVDVNLTMAQFNSGKHTLLLGYNDDIEAINSDGEYVYGWMVPHIPSQTWRPAVPITYEMRSISLDDSEGPITRECGEPDNCRLLLDPLRYRKVGPGHITGPHDSSTSLMNYLEWIACNRHDINGIFDALWYVSCCFSWKVGLIDSNLKSILSTGQALDLWMQAVLAWGSTVDQLLAALSAFHPTTAGLYTAEQGAYNALTTQYGAHVWYTTTHCDAGPCGPLGQDIPSLHSCPYWGMQA